MAYRNKPLAENEYYHVYNRGVDKRVIFLDEEDYRHFIYLMYLCNTEKSITLRDAGKDFDRGEQITALGAYCLMPNHFHILVKEIVPNGTSQFMKKLSTAYSMYFNKKYVRTGHLFEGIFKTKHIATDQYMKYMYSYIHINPAKLIDSAWKENPKKSKKELFEYIQLYPYSSIQEYCNKEKRVIKNKVLNIEHFPKYFETTAEHLKELFEWLSFINSN